MLALTSVGAFAPMATAWGGECGCEAAQDTAVGPIGAHDPVIVKEERKCFLFTTGVHVSIRSSIGKTRL